MVEHGQKKAGEGELLQTKSSMLSETLTPQVAAYLKSKQLTPRRHNDDDEVPHPEQSPLSRHTSKSCGPVHNA